MEFFNNFDDLPRKLEKNYIYEAVIELRYKTTVPIELVTVKLKDALGNTYKNPVKVFDVPEVIKQNIPDFNNAICYIMKNVSNSFSIGIGSKLISLRMTDFSYRTWKVFINEFKKIYEKISGYIDEKEQIGVRYINVFEGELLSKLNVDVNISSESILNNPLFLSWQIEANKRIIKSSIISKSLVNYTDPQNGEPQTISDALIFDIDCVYRNIEGIDTDIFNEINTNHNMVKGLFFGVCRKDFIEKVLVPVEGD